jgi:hypothetical protein
VKYLLTLILLLGLSLGCKPKILSGKKLEEKLIETMQKHLDKDAKPGVSYKVQDVAYYADKGARQYICDFHVHLHADKVDTTGIMTATIPNDFSTVQRSQ